MESFFDPHTNRPVDTIELAQGQTKILGLKKFNGNDVAVRTGDYQIAFCDKAIHLKDQTKKSYNDHYNLTEVAADTAALELNGSIFYQVCGNRGGTTEMTARFTNQPGIVDYAAPVTIKVTENRKRLALLHDPGFDTLWRNHPLNPMNPLNRSLYTDPSHPCPKSTWLVGQCMVRFSAALDKSGVKFDGFNGKKCGLPGPEHKHHFIDPVDFQLWKGLRDAYVWEKKPPYQMEPMPGIAAYYFTMGRRGVIQFENYFSADKKKKSDMLGGHIDLWNRNQMGNTFAFDNPVDGLSAFARSRKIVFWPLE